MNEGLPGDGTPLIIEGGSKDRLSDDLIKECIDATPNLFKDKIIISPPHAINLPFIKWLETVGIPTLKNEIREYEQEGFRAGLIGICEMIYEGSKEEKE